jgi:hypothetical protein
MNLLLYPHCCVSNTLFFHWRGFSPELQPELQPVMAGTAVIGAEGTEVRKQWMLLATTRKRLSDFMARCSDANAATSFKT